MCVCVVVGWGGDGNATLRQNPMAWPATTHALPCFGSYRPSYMVVRRRKRNNIHLAPPTTIAQSILSRCYSKWGIRTTRCSKLTDHSWKESDSSQWVHSVPSRAKYARALHIGKAGVFKEDAVQGEIAHKQLSRKIARKQLLTWGIHSPLRFWHLNVEILEKWRLTDLCAG